METESFINLIDTSIGFLSRKLVKEQGLSSSALKAFDQKLMANELYLPQDSKNFLREMNGFYTTGICFHGSTVQIARSDHNEYNRSLSLSQNCNLLDFNLKLKEAYAADTYDRIMLGESVSGNTNYLYAYNYYAPPGARYEQLQCTETMEGIPTLEVEQPFSSLSEMLRKLVNLKSNLNRGLAIHEQVKEYIM